MRAQLALLPFFLALFFQAGCASSPYSNAYSGTLEIDAPQVGSVVGGTVVEVRARDGERVRKGEVVVRFDDAAERARETQADSEENRARAELSLLRAGSRDADIRAARAREREAYERLVQGQAQRPVDIASAASALRQASTDVARARIAAQQARRDDARARSLHASGDLSRQAAESADTQYRQNLELLAASKAALATARRRAEAIDASTSANVAAMRAAYATAKEARIALAEGARPQEIRAATASLESAAAQARLQRALHKQLIVRAPTDGIIEDIAIHVGDLVPPGTAIATIVPDADPYVRIYVPQRDLGAFALGKSVRVHSDAYPSRAFEGRVEQIDRRAQFLPRDVQTPEDRADVDFGVKVRVADPQRLLRSGTTAEVLP